MHVQALEWMTVTIACYNSFLIMTYPGTQVTCSELWYNSNENVIISMHPTITAFEKKTILLFKTEITS